MNLPLLAARNVLRNKVRTGLTVLGVAVALLAFMTLRTVLTAWTQAEEYSQKDRMAVRSKISWVVLLPKKYVQEVKDMAGVEAVTWANWFGGRDPKHKDEFFANTAVDPESALKVWDEFLVKPEEKEAWLADRQGAIVGDVLARKMGWKLGSKVTLSGGVYPFDMEFNVRAIYTATRKGADRNQFMFQWAYLNEKLSSERQNRVGWLMVRTKPGVVSAELSKSIDDHFKSSGMPTLSQSELELNRSFLAAFTAILTAINVVSIVILAIMALILGNTIAMGVRERTGEYGVLRAIGFLPRHVLAFIVGESLVVGMLGGGLALLLGYPLINMGMGRWLEENMGGLFPVFGITTQTATAAMVLAVVLAAIAAAWPAWRAAQLKVVDALRRVG